jgi:hypothetical protein
MNLPTACAPRRVGPHRVANDCVVVTDNTRDFIGVENINSLRA